MIDWTADRDHHRSVVTYIGDPESVEAASVAAARFAIEGIDLRAHKGIHPRIGALDVLPFVPVHDLTMDSAVESARRVAGRLAAEGVPVYLYGEALSRTDSGRDPTDRSPQYGVVGSKLSVGGFPAGPRTGPGCSPVAGSTTSDRGRDLRRCASCLVGVERLCGRAVPRGPRGHRRGAP